MTPFLTAIVGLIGVYVAFALAASWINEQIATALQLRAKTLIAGVRAMIGDSAAADFFNHPLIASLADTKGQSRSRWRALTGLTFENQRIPDAAATPPSDDAKALKVPAYVSAEHFAAVIVDVLRKSPNPNAAATFGLTAGDVAAGINALGGANNPYKPLYDVLLPIWNDARADYDTFVAGLCSWYDSHMDRVSGWYKRSAQTILVYIALFIAIGLNVDSVKIVQELQKNTALANNLAATTLAYYQTHATQTPSPSASPSPSLPCNADCQTELSQLPIGWTPARLKDGTQSLAAVLLKLFGFLITTLAILLGAPFWFDLLGTIVNVRSAGHKPAPSDSASGSS